MYVQENEGRISRKPGKPLSWVAGGVAQVYSELYS